MSRLTFFDVYVKRITNRPPAPRPMTERVARATGRALSAATQRGRVLLALVTDCALRGVSQTTVEHVAVRAWRLWPEEFALRGFPEFPDTMTVRARLSGSESIVVEGYATRGPGGTVRVTPKALAWWVENGGRQL